MHPRAPGLLALCILCVLAEASPRALAQGDLPPLRLDGREVDLAHGVRPPSFLATPSDPFPDRTSLLIVQLREEPRDGLLETLRAIGIEVIQYVPEASFFARGTPAAAQRARSLSFVAWIGPFPPVLKLAPPLASLAESLGAAPSRRKTGTLDVIVQAFDLGDEKPLRNFLRDAGVNVLSGSRFSNRLHLHVLAPLEVLVPVARWPSVFRIEEFPRLQLHGERAAVIATGSQPAAAPCVTPGYAAWLERKGVRAGGVVVQVMDDGIEQGDASGQQGTAHPDVLGAIEGLDNATSDAEADSRSGHGSFNVGLICGKAATDVKDAAGFLLGQGIAPGARVFGTKIFNNLGRFDAGARSFASLVGQASSHGASISSNSWGATVFGAYDAAAAEFDALVRDAGPEPGEQPMTLLFSVGNEGDDVEGGLRSIGSPASAKNVISVGASETCGGEGRDGCGVTDLEADSTRDVPRFSSRGPLADGRLAPLIVAPGTHLSGIASTAVGYDGTGVCDPFWPQGQVLYARSSGTSHACPIVAGAAALFHEAYSARTGDAPSPALTRAAIIAAARDLAGGEDGFGGAIQPIPNDIQGWGLLAMEDLVADKGAAPRALFFDQRIVFGDAGDAWETTVFPLDPTKPVKVVLAWNDPPAVPSASPTLINDLDLEVASDGAKYRGNAFDGGASMPDGNADHLNNTECVLLRAPGPVLTVRVRAASVLGDGVPGGDLTDQDFALVVLGATDQSSRGVVTLGRNAYACDSLVDASVSDLDLKGRRSVDIVVESTVASQPITASLAEVDGASGLFKGTVRLGKEAGQLLVEDGASITARYRDADDGTGTAAESVATARIDCAPPAVTDVSVTEVTGTSALIAWSTVEDSTGKVLYGKSCQTLSAETAAGRRGTAHSVRLEGLDGSTRYYFSVKASDAVGNETTEDHGGACFSFTTSALVCGFEDDMEPEPSEGWTHRADQGPDDWTAAAFRGAHSATHAWHAAGFDGFKDASLVAPPLDLAPGDRLIFWHTFQLEKGYDGAVLEISTNGGTTWNDLGPSIVRGGYVEVISGNPLGDRLAWTGQRSDTMTEVEVDLAAWAGPGRLIRFRIGADSSFAEGFGWYIDDVGLCRSLNKRANLALDRDVYKCGDKLRVQLDDFDLVGAGTVDLHASSTSAPGGITVSMKETASRTGLFAADVPLDASPGGLPVADGDEIAVEYQDADDGSGDGPRSVRAQAVADCKAPSISGVHVVELFDDVATIAWETDEPTVGDVEAGFACDAPSIRSSLPMGGTSHVAVLEGLEPGKDYRYRITVRDEAGNVTRDDAQGVCRLFRPSALCTTRSDFEDAAAGWTHEAAAGDDAWSIVETPVARTQPRAWFLAGSEKVSDVSLISPYFLVPAGGVLAFWHTYEFEQGFDGGVAEISGDGGATWIDLGPQISRGGYDAVLVPPNPLAGRRAWTGGRVGPMKRVVIDLEKWAGAFARVRFRAVSDGSVGLGGWYMDHFEICQLPREEARLSLDRPAYGCGGRPLARVLDTGRIGLGTARIEVTSTSEVTPEAVDLAEEPPGSGIFEGSIDLVSEDAPGKLLVKAGDEIRAVYVDEDDGAGARQERNAFAAVDCTPPVISDVAVTEVDAESAVITWSTDEDSFGAIDLGPSCNALAPAGSAAAPAAAHRIRVEGLAAGARYFFRIRSTDSAGNVTVEDAAGVCLSFRTRVLFCQFEDDLEPAQREGWDAGGRWKLEASDRARSPTHVWRIVGEGRREDVALTLPVVLTEGWSVLEFWHTFEMAGGATGGIVEGSFDGGATWVDFEPWILDGGYTGFLVPGNPLEGRRAWTQGSLGAMTRVRVALDVLGDAEALIRLRWASLGAGPEGEWLVDDVRICRGVGESGFASFESAAYRCDTVASVAVADADLTGSGILSVEVSSPRQGQPLEVRLEEQHPGFFRGSFPIASAPAEGALQASDGDLMVVTYHDARDADGQAAVVNADTAVDCTAPLVSNLRVGAATFSTLELLWDTSEPARSRALFGQDCANLDRSTASGVLTTSHLAVLGGLQPGSQVAVKIEATDAAGNKSTSRDCAIVTIERNCVFEDSFEPAAAGWTHSAATGPDDWKVVSFDGSRSPTHSFHTANTGVPKDAVLVVPAVVIGADAVLSFWHIYDFEDGFDGGLIEVSTDKGLTWNGVGPDIFLGGYTKVISSLVGSVPGWTGTSAEDMTPVFVSLSKYAGTDTRIRFRALCDDSVGSGGWFIDDVSICTFSAERQGARFARGNCNGDEVLNLSDAVFLLNHLFQGGTVPGCRRSCDADSNDALNLTDAVYLLNYLFRGGPPLAPPESCDAPLEPSALECETDSCLAG